MLDILKEKIEEYKIEVEGLLAYVAKLEAKIEALTEVIDEVEEEAKEETAEMCNDEAVCESL